MYTEVKLIVAVLIACIPWGLFGFGIDPFLGGVGITVQNIGLAVAFKLVAMGLKSIAEKNMPETKSEPINGPALSLTALLSKDPNPIFIHKKTGIKYIYLTDALLEETGQPAVVYKNCDTGLRFVRPASEFCDGRFEHVA